jgi:hypothetical protein
MMNMSKGTKGRNIFGEVCTEKYLKLNKETAVQQYTEMMKDIVSHGGKIEYTVDSTCFTPDEAEEFFKMAECINIMYASMAGCRSYEKYALN